MRKVFMNPIADYFIVNDDKITFFPEDYVDSKITPVILNKNDYFIAYVYDNEYESSDKAIANEFNSIEDAMTYCYTESATGHIFFDKADHVVNGQVVETIVIN
jgi:hypothetical protein